MIVFNLFLLLQTMEHRHQQCMLIKIMIRISYFRKYALLYIK